MIAVSDEKLTKAERSQLDRREAAVASWARGDLVGADNLLNAIIDEGMTPIVAVRVFIAKAAVQAERSDYRASLEFLNRAEHFFDAADLHFQGAFFNQRARAHKELGNIDAAFTDYTGAAQCWETIGDPGYGAALLNLAGLYLRVADLPAARDYVEKAIAVFDETNSNYIPQGYDTLANIELADGRLEQAVVAIQKAFDLVADNEIWRQTFIETRNKIDEKLREVSTRLHQVNVDIVRWGLIKTGGNLTQTGKLAGLTHKGVSYIIDRHPDLESFRVKRRNRSHLKSIIKNH